MKKSFLIFFLLGIFLCLNVSASEKSIDAKEIIHGIDIEQVYSSSDWHSKEQIKTIINDYTLLLKYNQHLTQCSQNEEELNCINTLAENIITHFYKHNLNKNLNDYHNYVKSTSAAYGVAYCLNKYRTPSGTMCNQETIGKTTEIMEQYVKDLLNSIEQVLLNYEFIANYKD